MSNRVAKRALSEQPIGVAEAAPICNYHPEYLRKLIPLDDGPPFEKRRGRWEIKPSELYAWLATRGRAAS